MLAQIVAKECDGLPLALIVIGRAMAGAETPDEWERQIQVLKNYPEKFPGMEKHLFSRLAFSYDSLQDEATKSCFLYCSLFPEDYEIPYEQLIQLWVGEGFLDEYNGIKEGRNGGEEIIANLDHACLLENTISDSGNRFVKMHDVIRDMALWLTCQDGSKKKNKFVVVDKGGLVTTQQVDKWKSAQRISLFNTCFEEHIELPSFFNLQTLLLSGDHNMRAIPLSIPKGLFTYMPNIKVLDFTNFDGLKHLPMDIEKLSTLQYLNLTYTGIREIPKGLGNLKRLRCLILDYTSGLKNFPSQIISGLSSLQLFSFKQNSSHAKYCGATLEELEGLKCIGEVSISLDSVHFIETLMNSHKLRQCLKSLDVWMCSDIDILHLSSPHLEKLEVFYCSFLKDVAVNLEKEGLHSTFPRHQPLSQLSNISITCCGHLKKLTCLAYAPNLKFLSVMSCSSLEELVQIEECEISNMGSELDLFLRLSHLDLTFLGKLRSICRWNLLFPSLKQIRVRDCPNLRKLPFDSNTTRGAHLEAIIGEQEWWEQLEWEDETIMHDLTPYFKRF